MFVIITMMMLLSRRRRRRRRRRRSRTQCKSRFIDKPPLPCTSLDPSTRNNLELFCPFLHHVIVILALVGKNLLYKSILDRPLWFIEDQVSNAASCVQCSAVLPAKLSDDIMQFFFVIRIQARETNYYSAQNCRSVFAGGRAGSRSTTIMLLTTMTGSIGVA